MDSLKEWIADNKSLLFKTGIGLSLAAAFLYYNYKHVNVHHLGIIRDQDFVSFFTRLDGILHPIIIKPNKEVTQSSIRFRDGFDYRILARNTDPAVLKYARNILYSTICESTSVILEERNCYCRF
jgi:hypothetical protein